MKRQYIKNISNNQQGGTALFITMVIMSGFLLITLTASDVIRNGLTMSKTQMESTKAYFAAEAGAERILWDIRRTGPPAAIEPGDGGGGTGLCQVTPGKYCFTKVQAGDISSCVGSLVNCPASPVTDSQKLSNEAFYKIYFQFEGDVTLSTTTLSSRGSIMDVNRTVEVSY